MKRLLFLLPLCFLAATYGPPFSVSDFSSLTNRPNPSFLNPTAVVLGKTNAYDGNGGIFVFTPSSTNAVDNDIYLPTTTTGRWVRLTRDLVIAQSPLVLSNGLLSINVLTNYFTFLAGTNMQVTVTSNTVSYAMTNTTFSGSGGVTVNALTATNFWDNGYITFLDAGGGDWSLNIGDDTISTNKINSTFYNWVLSLAGAGGGTTNGLGVNGTFRTDWNAINSAEIAYTVSAGMNWYGSLIAGSVAASKLATTGTGTSTNFLAGDFAYKQVTTNMIPGLNAILATIGSGGGSGGESNTASNLGTPSATNQGWYASKSGVDLRFRSLTVGPNLTLTSNANDVVLNVTLSTNSGTVVSVDGGSSLATVNFADTTGIGVTLATPNASFALIDRDFGDLTTSSSGTVMTLDNSVVTSNKLAAANVTQDKLSASGTPLSTNFLAGDYSYKQVTTNMIPGLNAILATIGTGGSGGGLGTNLFVNNILSQPAKLTNSTTIVWSTNSNGDIVATATNVPGTTTDNVWQVWGGANFIITNNASTGDIKASTLTYSGGITNATLIGNTGSGDPAIVRFDFASRNTNYFVVLEIESENGASFAVGGLNYNTKSTNSFQIWLTAPFASDYSGGYWTRVRMMDQVSVGGNGGDVTQAGNNTFTGTNTFSGTTTFNNLSIGSITVVTNLSVPNNAYGSGWNGSTNVPNENSVYDEMELRATKSSPTFSGTLTNTGSIGAPVQYVGSTNIAEALAAKQPLDSDLTSMAAGTAVATAQTNAVSMGAPTLYVGTTNVAAALAAVYNVENGDSFSDGDNFGTYTEIFYPNWYGVAIAGGSPGSQVATTNNPSSLQLNASASANSGYAYLSGTTAEDIGSGGKEFFAIVAFPVTNAVIARIGFQDSTSDTEPTDGAYIRLANGYVYGVLRNNSSQTTTTTSNQIATSSTAFYRALTRVNTDQASVTYWLLSATAPGVYTTNWTASVTNTLPTGSSRLTGHGVEFHHTSGSAGTTIGILDAMSKRNTRLLTR